MTREVVQQLRLDTAGDDSDQCQPGAEREACE
jgi:hypothetical protein